MNLIFNSVFYRWRDVNSRPLSSVSDQQPSSDVGENHYVLTVIALIAASAALRLIMIGSQSLWLDEGFSLAMTDSKSIFGTFSEIWSTSGGDKYQPLYFVILALWRAVIGDSQVTLQILSVVFGALAPALLYMGVKPLFGHRHALLSALFMVCSAFCVSYSQEVRPYSYLLFLVTCQFLVFSPALNGQFPSRTRIVGFSIITFICCLSSVFSLLFSMVMAFSFLVCYRDLRLWVRWWGLATAAAIPAVLYFAFTPAATDLSTDAINTTNVDLWQNTIFAIYGHVAGHTYGPSVSALRTTSSVLAELSNYHVELIVLVVVCGVLVVNTFRVMASSFSQGRSRSLHLFFVSLAVLSFIAAFAFALATSINWMPRHSFYLMLPLSVLLPISIFRYQKTERSNVWDEKLSNASVAAFAGLLLINFAANSNYYFNSEHWRDDYRSAANYLNAHVEEGDASIMLWGEPYLLEYYGHTNIEGLWRLEDADLIFEKINTAVLERDHVYVSINREPSWERYSEILYRLIHESYDLVPAAEFNSFISYKLEPKKQLHAAT